MKLIEYEAKSILKSYAIPLPNSQLVKSSTDKVSLPTVLKSQVPIGGRGKAGGIKVVTGESELFSNIEALFALHISGFTPRFILAEELLLINKEFYLSLVLNRQDAIIELVVNRSGGIEVEDNDPTSFLRLPFTNQPDFTIVGEQVAEFLDIPDQSFALQEITQKLYSCFISEDATLIEINPFVLTKDSRLVAGDCKMELDDTAEFRHPEWNFEETIANVNFVTVDKNGTVATIANGAGLGMATVDAVAEAKLSPANFLDIGGGATSESILEAFRKIMEYPNIKAIVINVFAGITRCDEVARAIITARQQLSHLPPLSIRLAGTNFEQAVELLAKEGINTFETLEECLANTHEVIHA
jgi:succinyl-CoA synthetase beta subunit